MARKIEVRDGVVTDPGTGQALDPTGGFRDPVGEPTQPASPATPAGVQQDIFGGGASTGVQAKLQEALGPQQPTQPTQSQNIISRALEKIGQFFAGGLLQQYAPPGTADMLTQGLESMLPPQVYELFGAGALTGVGIVAGAAGAGGSLYTTSLTTPGKIALFGGPAFSANVKTHSLVMGSLVKKGLLYTAITSALSITFGKFQINEGIDKLNGAARRADDLGTINPKTGAFVADEIRTEVDKLLEFGMSLESSAPVWGAIRGTIKNMDAAFTSNAAYKLIAEHERNGITTWDKINAEKETQAARITTKNIELWAIHTAAERALDKIENAEEREAAAKFWAEYAAQQRVLEELERQKIAAFWLAYWENKLKLQTAAWESRSSSTLSFGLF